MMRELFNKGGVAHWRDPKTGREYNLEHLKRRRSAIARANETRSESTLKERIRQELTRSIDVPNSRESRIVIADYAAAKRIRNCLMPVINDEPKADWNFYTGRMAQAIAYVAGRRQIEYDSDEYRQLQAFLWMVWKNWRDGKAQETIAALEISEDAYYERIRRLQAHFDHPEWAAYLICCALAYGVKLRQQEERDNDAKGGILPPDWL